SICQINNIKNDDGEGNISILSFSVLFIFLHFLFELRLNKKVCQFVTIITRILGEVRVFFLIFATGILAFTIAILHLLRGCPVNVCEEKNIKFPFPFHLALSSTYFFMGGRWDPVSENFEKDDWAFHMMMILYFFFTVILLLNVLITLMNMPFNAGDESWQLVWMESRLRWIERAENIAHNIPGLRNVYDLFPQKIYYFATQKQQKKYWEKYSQEDCNDLISSTVSGDAEFQKQAGLDRLDQLAFGSSGVVPTQSILVDLGAVKQGQEELREQHEAKHEELKQELDALRNQLAHDVVRQEMNALRDQLAEMKDLLAQARKAIS
ncbi:hypothetical protein BGZ65_002902, partial [Modicella reniformis]